MNPRIPVGASLLAICRKAAVKPDGAVFQVERVIVYRQQAGSYG